MDILQLVHFLSIAETLHFGRSSRKCNLSPSAFTRSIKRLEEELGYKLLERNNRYVALTTAGQLFRQYASEILDSLSDFQHNAVISEKTLKGEISLFCTVTASYSILLPIMKKFRNEYPDINIKLQTGDAGITLQKVLDNEADVSIAVLPDKLPDNLDFFPLTVTPLVFIAPDFDTKFITREERSPVFEKCPLILPEKGVARNRIDDRLSACGIKPDIYAQISGNEAILSMVSLGCGIGLVPKLVIDSSPFKDSVRILDFDPPLEPYQLGLCSQKKRGSNPFVRAFCRAALEGNREAIDFDTLKNDDPGSESDKA
ncbi:MAG: HTH-type transcriptional activator IlvY [Spirochaetia bacterium]|nr:HTH-type transcriptional activator IlvY [Spirochaetia bacterium]